MTAVDREPVLKNNALEEAFHKLSHATPSATDAQLSNLYNVFYSKWLSCQPSEDPLNYGKSFRDQFLNIVNNNRTYTHPKYPHVPRTFSVGRGEDTVTVEPESIGRVLLHSDDIIMAGIAQFHPPECGVPTVAYAYRSELDDNSDILNFCVGEFSKNSIPLYQALQAYWHNGFLHIRIYLNKEYDIVVEDRTLQLYKALTDSIFIGDYSQPQVPSSQELR
ncbi:MAG: hypothetical protein ACEQSA_01640 [Weeksellaceae bacterium]